MAQVNLRGVFFNVAADPADRLAVMEGGDLARVREAPGRVVRGAGGRVRVIRRAGTAQSWSLSLPGVTGAAAVWLEDHVGQLVCVRDVRGHKVFGVFLAVDMGDVPGPDELVEVSLAVSEVSYSEAV